MIARIDADRWPLVELLLCAADLARQGNDVPLSSMTDWFTGAEFEAVARRAYAARDEVLAVSPRAFEYHHDLLADTLLEAAYRVAEGRGVGGAP